MEIKKYNRQSASNTFGQLSYGDTFYWRGEVCMKVLKDRGINCVSFENNDLLSILDTDKVLPTKSKLLVERECNLVKATKLKHKPFTKKKASKVKAPNCTKLFSKYALYGY